MTFDRGGGDIALLNQQKKPCLGGEKAQKVEKGDLWRRQRPFYEGGGLLSWVKGGKQFRGRKANSGSGEGEGVLLKKGGIQGGGSFPE